MFHDAQSLKNLEQPWLCDFLAEKGFQRTAAGTFSNGRAILRIEGTVLHAIPGEGTKGWRSELRGARPDSIRQLLNIILDGPSFLSQVELDRRVAQRTAANQALNQIANTILEAPESDRAWHLRGFLWSLFNQHHIVNLWSLKDAVDTRDKAAASDLFCGWMQAGVSEDSLRRALVDSGEMDRWDCARSGLEGNQRLADVLLSVNDILKDCPPGIAMSRLTQAATLLRQVESLWRP